MRQFSLRVAEIATFGGQRHVRCEGGPAPQTAPGQGWLALADVPAQSFLRLPLFPFPDVSGRWEFFLPPAHPFAALAPGSTLDLLGPFGRSFHFFSRAAHLLAVADSLDRIYPILHAALARRLAVTLLAPERRGESVGPGSQTLAYARPYNLPDLPLAIEVHHGAPTAELVGWADVICADVPDPQALASAVRDLRPGQPQDFVQAFLAPPILCGTGACQACWMEIGHGRALACVEGPVFSLGRFANRP